MLFVVPLQAIVLAVVEAAAPVAKEAKEYIRTDIPTLLASAVCQVPVESLWKFDEFEYIMGDKLDTSLNSFFTQEFIK